MEHEINNSIIIFITQFRILYRRCFSFSLPQFSLLFFLPSCSLFLFFHSFGKRISFHIDCRCRISCDLCVMTIYRYGPLRLMSFNWNRIERAKSSTNNRRPMKPRQLYCKYRNFHSVHNGHVALNRVR